MKIPKIIHFIWAGGNKPLPKKNIDVIKLWHEKNRAFQIYLWVDSKSSLNKPFIKTLDKYLKNFNFGESLQIKDIEGTVNADGELVRMADDYIRYEIDRLRPNYGASSDRLRYKILEEFGGAYFDSDVLPVLEPWTRSLTDSGIFEKEYDEHILYVDTNSQNSATIGNDTLICTAKNPAMRRINESALLHYHLQHEDIIDNDPYHRTLFTLAEANSLVALAYQYDDLGHIKDVTPVKTGPFCVRKVIVDSEPNNDLADDHAVNSSVVEQIQGEEAEVKVEFGLGQETIKRNIERQNEGILPNPYVFKQLYECGSNIKPLDNYTTSVRNGNSWVNIEIDTFNFNDAVTKLLQAVSFEIKNYGVFRMDDHISNLITATDCTREKAFEKVTQIYDGINNDEVKIIQISFVYAETINFFKLKNLEKLTFLFPLQRNCYEATKNKNYYELTIDIVMQKKKTAEINNAFSDFKIEEREKMISALHKFESIIKISSRYQAEALAFCSGLLDNNSGSKRKSIISGVSEYLDCILVNLFIQQNHLMTIEKVIFKMKVNSEEASSTARSSLMIYGSRDLNHLKKTLLTSVESLAKNVKNQEINIIQYHENKQIPYTKRVFPINTSPVNIRDSKSESVSQNTEVKIQGPRI
jgi:hypothetical protein